MAINETKITGKKYRVWDNVNSIWKRLSFWTKSEDVEMGDGNSAETNLGAIKGITSSLSSTSANYALSASAGKSLQDSVNTLNTNLGKKAPTSHASTGTGYGIGTTSNYGHLRIVDTLTQSKYYDGYALSPHQGYVLKQLIDTLNGIGTVNSALRFYGTSSQNYTYGCYDQGIYTITGTEVGIPEANYPGYMLTLRHSNSHIVKIAFLVNSHVHVMGQGTDGTVASNWRRLAIAGVDC